MNRTIALVMILLGIVMLVWSGFAYTQKEKLVDAGPVQISADRVRTFSWPPYVGGIIIAAGVIILITSKRK